MPFTDPVVESITANIASELAEVVAGVAAADGQLWNYTLSVIRPKDSELGKETWGDLTVLVVQGKEELLTNAGLRQMVQRYAITAFVADGDNATDPIDIKKNRVAADIKKKLMEVPKRGHANVTMTTLGDCTPFRPGTNGGFGGIGIDVGVEYQTQSGNPYA
jgi:hypothetical protein